VDRRAAVEKVKKLLRRARVNPGHEADTALALAKELIQKFDLFELEVEPQENGSVLLESKVEPWKEILAFGVAQALRCRVFKKPTGELYVSGGTSSISLVFDLYISLRDYALRSCGRKVPVSLPVHNNLTYVATLLDKVWTNRFLYGFAKTIVERLTETETTSSSPSTHAVHSPVQEAPHAPANISEQVPTQQPASNNDEDDTDETRYDTDDVEVEPADEPAPDLGNETRTEEAEQVANSMVLQGHALIREFSHGWSFCFAADYAEGIYVLAFNHGRAAGSIVDLDTRSFVSRRQLAC